MELLNKQLNFDYEYVICSFSDALNMLEDGTIDIMFGVALTPERRDKIKFNKYSISLDSHALVTNLDITIDDLKNLNGLRCGLIADYINSEWILDLFTCRGINLIPVYAESFNDLEELLAKNEVDIIMYDKINTTSYNVLYAFAGYQVYIVSNKNNSNLLNQFDKAINIYSGRNSKIFRLYEKYFIPDNKDNFTEYIILLITITATFLIVLLVFIIPKLKMKKIRKKIKARLNNKSYHLNYQPIYNPRNNNIVGFEALLRLTENNKVIFPTEFINDIENSNMLYDVSLWIVNEVIRDYKKIKNFKCINGRDFYISLNLSLNEIENKTFVENIIKMLSNSGIGPNNICLEIVERVKMNDIDKTNKYISALRSAGFKIAIDDFGIEYSNLDIIRKLDFDIIKVDKYFVDTICKDEIQKEIVLFINSLAISINKSIVVEGIEDINQHNLITNINNERLYVQGYFYNKPMGIHEIEKM